MPLGQKRSSISGLGKSKSSPPRGEENPKHGGYRVDSWHLIGKQWSHGDIHPNKEAAERQVARMLKAGFKPQWVRIVEMTNSTPRSGEKDIDEIIEAESTPEAHKKFLEMHPGMTVVRSWLVSLQPARYHVLGTPSSPIPRSGER